MTVIELANHTNASLANSKGSDIGTQSQLKETPGPRAGGCSVMDKASGQSFIEKELAEDILVSYLAF